jgi:hypothetical protein
MKRILFLCLSLCVLFSAGCDGGGGGPTGPANAPILDQQSVRVNPPQANPGSIVIFSIDFVDVPGDLNGGAVVITDNQGFRYDGIVSNADSTAGTLTTSITLSPLVRPGDLVFTILIWDRAGNQATPIVYATIVVL